MEKVGLSNILSLLENYTLTNEEDFIVDDIFYK